MRDFIISTDSTADLPASFVQENDIIINPLYYIIDNIQHADDKTVSESDFYNRMRQGSLTGTAASNPESFMKVFTKKLEEGYDILHISFSSGLSSSYNNAALVAFELKESHPGARIEVVDSRCASLGQGLFVYYAVKLKKEGRSLEEIVDWLIENRNHFCHQFTVDDLKYLYRGGRVSKTAAILGSIINIKPVLHVDDDGHLIPLNNVRGRKKALLSLVDNMEALTEGVSNEAVFISHCDCLGDAEFVASKVKERFGIDNILINQISPVIGSHSGPGTVALFFLGNHR